MPLFVSNTKHNQIHYYLQGEYMTPRVVNLILRYLGQAIIVSQTWKIIKPHVETLITKFVFPLMCFNDEDEELWQDDPQEYIRKVTDITSHCNLLIVLCSNSISMIFCCSLTFPRMRGLLIIMSWLEPWKWDSVHVTLFFHIFRSTLLIEFQYHSQFIKEREKLDLYFSQSWKQEITWFPEISKRTLSFAIFAYL